MKKLGSLVLSLALLATPALTVAANAAKEGKSQKAGTGKQSGHHRHSRGAGAHKAPTAEPKAEK